MEVVKEDIQWPTSERESVGYSQIAIDINQARKHEAGSDGERTRTALQQNGLNNSNEARSNNGGIRTAIKTMVNQVLTDLTSITC